MTPSQYHELLIGLDRTLFVFHESEADMTDKDRKLQYQIAVIHSRVLEYESGQPFHSLSVPPPRAPDETRPPFSFREQ